MSVKKKIKKGAKKTGKVDKKTVKKAATVLIACTGTKGMIIQATNAIGNIIDGIGSDN